MKKRLAVLAVLTAASGAWADGIIYDGFNYSALGTPFLGVGPSGVAAPATVPGPGGAWVYQGNNVTEPRVVSGSLNYTGVASSGNSAQIDNNNGMATGAASSRLYLGNLDKATTPTLYYSMILSIPSYSPGSSQSPFFAGFDNLNASSYTSLGGLFIREDGTTANIDLGIGTSANPVGGATNRALSGALPHDTPLFVVGSFTFQGKSTLDIYTNPAAVPAALPASHQLTSTAVDQSTATTVTNFFLRGNTGEPQGIKVDELRIGSAWADVATSHVYYWDTDGVNPGGGGAAPSGSWDGTTQNFNTDSSGGGGGTLSGAPATLDTVTFSANHDATGTYNVSVSGSQGAGLVNIPSGDVTFNGTGTLNVGTFNVAAGATVVVTSNVGGRPGLVKTGDGAMTVSGPIVFTGGAVVNGGSLTISSDMTTSSGAAVSGGMLTLANNLTSVTSILVTGGTLQSPSGAGGNRMIKTTSVTTAGTGRLDLEDNKMITQFALGGWNTGTMSYDGVTGFIKAGRNGGAWNGAGIVTGMPAAQGANSLTTLAVATAGDVKGISGTQTALFGGQTVGAADTIVMYTYAGDADLSGAITGDDYFRIDQGFASQTTATPLLGYENGDFNYDGRIDADDYFIIDRNLSRQGTPFSAGEPVSLDGAHAVPEPACALVLMTVGAGLMRRRRVHM